MWDFSKYAGHLAVIDDRGQKTTYAELENFGKALVKNIPSRCLVFCLCENTLGSLIGYTAFLNNRIVPLMLDSHLDKELLKQFVEEYKPDYIWLPSAQIAEVKGKEIFSSWNYSLIKTENNHAYPLYDELALLLTTSGSTGSPKFVRQSYKNIETNTKSIVEYLHLTSGERPITVLPMNYTFGLSVINTHLAVGATLLLTDKTIMQRDFWDFMNANEATSFSGVPYTYEMLNKLMFFRRQLPHLKTMTQAGGKLLPELHKKFAEWAKTNGKNFVVMYGSAEATARMGYLPPEISLEKWGCMGKAIPGGKFALIDAEGKEIKETETVGELVYEGDNVTLGYALCGADLAKGDENNGRLSTGDMAKIDADGIYTIVGRKKRFLKIFGNRVGLDETERLIKSCFDDMECACAGKDDEMHVYITVADKCATIRSFLAEKTKLNPTAFHVQCVNCIPKNSAGKTLYQELEKLYA